jgi:ribosomal protein S18 acetylase RimI-like enzyme
VRAGFGGLGWGEMLVEQALEYLHEYTVYDGDSLRFGIEQGLAEQGFVDRRAIRFKSLGSAGHSPPEN